MPGESAVGEAVDARTEEDVLARPSGSTETYYRRDAAQGPLIVVYHIQKTAGTSLRRLVRANLPPSEPVLEQDLQKLRYRPDELLRWHRDWYGGLDPARRARRKTRRRTAASSAETISASGVPGGGALSR